MSEQSEAYEYFLLQASCPWCWACGASQAPSWWNAAPFLRERAHIVNKPRVEDRRAVILLCTACHNRSHGLELAKPWPRLTLSGMLWLKLKFDPKFYDRKWLELHSVGKLPRAEFPGEAFQRLYNANRGNYPWVRRLRS